MFIGGAGMGSQSLGAGHGEVALQLMVDIVAIVALAVALYFRRHRRADMAMVFTFFNLCLFVVVAVIQRAEVSAALGFGLFGILSIIRLRSEPFDNREIGYFVGALVLGLLNGIGTDAWWFTLALNALLLLAMAILDHPAVLASSQRQSVVLDRVYKDPVELRSALSERLGATVTGVEIISIDFVRDAMQLDVRIATPTRARALR
jgi:Domain of unknown function (DUF4956)